MSKETALWLNTNTLVGFTDKRGNAWHWRADLQTVDPVTGHVGNHYPSAIPFDHVERRLFNWTPESAPLSMLVANPGYDADKPYDFDPEIEAALDTISPDVADRIRWQLMQSPHYTNAPELVLPVQDYQAIIRSDNHDIMGIHTDGYQSHDYREWLLRTIAVILDDDLQVGSAGLLANGAKAWVSVEMTENFTTPEGVEFRPYLLAMTSLDGTLATTYKRVVQLVVCDNTLEIARSEKGQQYKVKHTKNSAAKIGDARAALQIIHNDADDFAAEVKALTATTVTDKQWSEFLELHVPIAEDASKAAQTRAEHKREAWSQLWNGDPRVTPWKGTAFGVMQAGNTWWTHESIAKKGVPRIGRIQESILRGKGAEHDAQVMADLNKVLSNA